MLNKDKNLDNGSADEEDKHEHEILQSTENIEDGDNSDNEIDGDKVKVAEVSLGNASVASNMNKINRDCSAMLDKVDEK